MSQEAHQDRAYPEVWRDKEYFYSTPDGIVVHRSITPALSLLVPTYTPWV